MGSSPVRSLTLALAVLSAQLTSGQTTSYERFYLAFTKNDLSTLRSISEEPIKVPDEAWINGVAKATLHLRAAELPQCLILLDSLNRATTMTDPLGHGWVYKLQAVALDRIGSHSLALEAITSSLAYHARSLHPLEHTEQLIIRSEIHRGLNEHALALNDIRQAAIMADSADHPRARAMIEIGLGNMAYEREEYNDAKVHFERCFQMARKDGFVLLANNALNNLGNAAIMSGDAELARRCYLEALAEFGSTDPLQYSDLLDQLGYVLRETGAVNEALRNFDRSLQLKDSLSDAKGIPRVLLHSSTALWLVGRKKDALSNLERAVRLARSEGDVQVELEGLSSLAYYHALSGQHELAYAEKNAEMWLNDSLIHSRFSEQASMNKILFETERKEHRIAEQEQALELATEETNRKALQRNALIAATGLILIIALLLLRTLRSRQRLAAKEKELHHEQVDQLLSQQEIKSINAMLEGQEKERDRLAKDLHDRLGSMLGGIKANMAALEDRVAQMRQDQQYQKVTRLMDQAVGELRQISHDMAAATLSRFGLEKALKDLRDTIHINGRLHVELNTFGLDDRLDRSIELATYRMVQELVSNVLKHAKARELSIALTRSPGRLSLVVADDGVGFDITGNSDGMGLANVRSRASALGATVQVDSTPGKGTTVSVECPVVE